MATVGSSAKRYALALYEIAKERSKTEQWGQEWRAIVQAIRQPEVAAVLRYPRLPLTNKRRILTEVAPSASPEVVNLALLLISRRRLDALALAIADEYDALLDRERGIIQVKVTTAVPLDAGQQQAIIDQLGRELGSRIKLQLAIDPSIVGGMVVRVGDRVIDGSVRTRLMGLKRNLQEALR